jgi:hypothetical protein
MGIYELICDAMDKHQPMSCYYDSHYREFCPTLIGYKTTIEKKKKMVVSTDTHMNVQVFQFGGRSEKPLPFGGSWKCWNVDKMRNVQIIQGNWLVGRPGLKVPETCVDDIRHRAR